MYLSHGALGLSLSTTLKENKLLPFFLIVLSVEFMDLLAGIFIVLGIEGGTTFGSVDKNFFDLPWSHSFVMVIIWTLVYGVLCFIIMKYRNSNEAIQIAIVSGLGVFSHWIFDIVVHTNDMYFDPISDPKIVLPSLYIWESPIISFFLELGLILVFWGYYYYMLKKQERLLNNRIFYSLVVITILHISFYAPSFTNMTPVGIDWTIGISFIAIILLVTYVLTFIHKISTKIS